MKIQISQESLSKGINIVQKGISARTTLPILNGILLKAIDGNLILTGTDLELGIETSIPCTVLEQGNIVITSRLFGEIIRKLPSKEINIEVINNNVNIECDNSKFNILGQSFEEYPEIPKINEERSFSIERDLLKDMIKQTIFATSLDETRPILTGALMEIENSNISLVALDGYRLSLKKAKIAYEDSIKIVIPRKTLSELSKIIEEDNKDIKISTTNNHIIFNVGETLITSRLLEGQFLNYKDIIREEYKTKITLNTKEFQESIERASLLAREGKNNLVRLSVTENNLEVTSKSDLGDVLENISSKMEGESLEIAFNSKYILDGIKVINSSEIDIYLTSSVNPCIIKPVNDENYIYLVLPVRMS